jgi:hypothetical protein
MRATAIVAILLCAGVASARTRTYAVIVAENRSLDPGVRPLQFADDDGAKTWELFSLFADQAALFVVLDADTARTHPEAARHAESPERAAIFERLAQFNTQMAADLSRGDEPELFFIYAGHGDVDGAGQGYVNLRDAKLTRAELYRDIIAPSKARFVHVIVDACKSYFLVNARGSKPWVDDRVSASEEAQSGNQLRAFLEEEQLERHPRAGVIVATSGDQESHEWARYRGGILSHELRSALTGAADVNGDGRVEYSELRAFLAAANARVRNPEARVDVFARAPALDRHRALIDLKRVSGTARLLHFGPGLDGHFFVEDERGVRTADLNKERGAAVDVVVAGRRGYFVRRENDASSGADLERDEAEVRAAGQRRVDVAALSWHARAIASRGALDTTFRQDLYRVPYGRGFYDGFVATSGDAPVEDVSMVQSDQPRERRYRLSAGYLFSTSPAGDAGASHGIDARFLYRYWRALDIGLAAEVGYGSGASGESLTRVAALAVVGAEWRPIERLGLRLENSIGWQLLSGTVQLKGQAFSGSEARGLRYELAGGASFDLMPAFGLFARGGLGVDGLWPAAAPSGLKTGGFISAGVHLQL